jgi:hypothetical protein
MARRALSVFCRYGVASVGALSMALACLNPQNDDLPSNGDLSGSPVTTNPDQGTQGTPGSSPGNNAADPEAPASPPSVAPPLNGGDDDSPEPSDNPGAGVDAPDSDGDAGTSPDAGALSDLSP